MYFSFWAVPVPNGKRGDYADHSKLVGGWFLENGATRIIESWGESVPHGKQTDWHRAVAAGDDETPCVGFAEWPDQATCDAAKERMEDAAQNDERFDDEKHPMPFDGKRMIFGDFAVITELQR
ncbi:MAG: DUF1428 domain-containing protein [Pontixanthobacter sp.]